MRITYDFNIEHHAGIDLRMLSADWLSRCFKPKVVELKLNIPGHKTRKTRNCSILVPIMSRWSKY